MFFCTRNLVPVLHARLESIQGDEQGENYGYQETCHGGLSSRLVDWTSRFLPVSNMKNLPSSTNCIPMIVIMHEPISSLGIGKTTLIKQVCLNLKKHRDDIDMSGFYTEEVREGGGGGRGRGGRIGFDVVTLSGERGILARIPS